MQASLPIRLEGLGLHSAQSLAAAAFVGSCNASHQLVNQLLGYSSKSLSSELDDASSTSTVDMVEIQGEVVINDLLCQQLSSVLPATFQIFLLLHKNQCSHTLTEFNCRL